MNWNTAVIPRVRILALLSRSMRTEARAWPTYVARGAVVMVVLFSMFFIQITAAFFGAPGKQLFSRLVYLNLVVILMASSYFSGTITEEKEEQTLGLLKMTGLNSISILLGKSVSKLVGAALFLLLQLPFTMLAVTLGGVSVAQIFASFATLLALLVLVSGVGVLCSVVCARTGPAARLTGFLLFLFLISPVLLWLLGELLQWKNYTAKGDAWDTRISLAVDFLKQLSPFIRIGDIMGTTFGASPFGIQFWSNVLLGLLCFSLAWLVFEGCTRDDVPAAPSRATVVKAKSRLRLLGAGRTWSAALAWKDFYFIAGGKFGLITRSIVLFAVVWAIDFIMSFNSYRGNRAQEIGSITMLISLVVAVIELAAMSGKMFAEEVKWKTLPALMVLPLTPAQIAYRKLAGLLLGLTPSAAFFCMGALLAPEQFVEGVSWFFGNIHGYVIVAAIVTFVHIVAYFSLRTHWGLLVGMFLLFSGFWCFIFILMAVVRSVAGGMLDPLWVVVILSLAVVTVMLHMGIGRQLTKLAGE